MTDKKKKVTGKPSVARTRLDLPERTGDTPGGRAANMRGARGAIAKKAGWNGRPGDRKDGAVYNPKSAPDGERFSTLKERNAPPAARKQPAPTTKPIKFIAKDKPTPKGKDTKKKGRSRGGDY